MSGGGPRQERGQPTSRLRVARRLSVAAGVLAIIALYLSALLVLPRWDVMVRPTSPTVETAVERAIDEADDGWTAADLRLKLAALQHGDAVRRDDLRNLIGQIGAGLLAGAAAAWGTLVAWRQWRHTRDSTAEQLRLVRSGQAEERLGRAVDRLGSPDVDVRVAGVHALERLALNPLTDLDLLTIGDLLTDLVRRQDRHDDASEEGDADPDARSPDVIAADAQAAMDVLGRLPRMPLTPRGAASRFDLNHANLRGAQLNGAQLQHAELRDAHLEEACLVGAQLDDADLRSAHLDDADLTGAHLERADLRGAYLMGTTLQRANLEHANLTQAFLYGANLRRARLAGAKLWGTRLARGARLWDADLEETHLTNALAAGSTEWPSGFRPADHGVRSVMDDDADPRVVRDTSIALVGASDVRDSSPR